MTGAGYPKFKNDERDPRLVGWRLQPLPIAFQMRALLTESGIVAKLQTMSTTTAKAIDMVEVSKLTYDGVAIPVCL